MRAPWIPLVAGLVAAFGLAVAAMADALAAEPVLLGQSLPLTGPGFPAANRVQAGVRAYVERLNATGGIAGHRVELLSLDDGGDPRRTEANVRLLARRGAVAVLNCLGEAACRAAAAAAEASGVPLVGPLSGDAALREPSRRQVFPLRPTDQVEAAAMARQMRSMGILRVALLVDGSAPARDAALWTALRSAGVAARSVPWTPDPRALAGALAGTAGEQALVLALDVRAVEILGALPAAVLAEVPTYVWTPSGDSQTQVTRIFRDHVVGFTSVVPDPEVSQLPLVRELQRDADAWVGPEALSFEGLAAYLSVRLCAEGLRHAGPARPTPAALAAGLESLGTTQIGGWPVHLGPDSHAASDFVEVGLRGRDGLLRR